jgi:ATP-binding cassette, subfamily C, bacterial
LESCEALVPRGGPVGEGYRTAKAYVTFVVRRFPGRVLLVLALMVAVGLVEWLGLLLLAPLLSLAGLDLGGGTVSRIAGIAEQLLAGLRVPPTLPAVLVIYAGVIAGRAALRRWQSMTMVDLEGRLVRDIRSRLFRAILRARWTVVSRKRSSELLHALTSQVSRVGHATDHLLPLAAQVVIVAVYLLFAFLLSPMITLLVVASGLTLLLVLRREARRAFATGERMTAATGDLYAACVEQLNGLKTVRSYRAEERTAGAFDVRQREVVAAQMDAQRNFTRVRLLSEIAAVTILAVMLWVTVEVVALAVAEVLLLIYLFGRVVPRLSQLQQSHQYFVNALPAFRDVMQAIEACEAESEPEGLIGAQPIPLHEGVRLAHVSFRYTADGSPAVRDLELDIPAHRTTAIVGPSGAGKTTIADLVMGLIAPESGQILVDGVPLESGIVPRWREQIGYVPQETFLFHDTIRANLLWARPTATEGELREALRLASADVFVRRLPNGMETVIGDRGVLLAGGERQRLALARALLRSPALLILDEATSSLDSENERQIQHAIERLHGRTTMLVITHRLATIRDADVIHVMENGRLVESGSWWDLVRKGGRFEDLCRAQRIATAHSPRQSASLAAAGN